MKPSTDSLVGALRDLDLLANRMKARWLLLGGRAVVAWGRIRFTADVDASIEVDVGDVDSLLRSAEALGFERRDAAHFEAAKRSRVLLLRHRASGQPVDLMYGASGLEQAFFERARALKIGRQVTPVISPEDLIVTKILAGRAQDELDVEGILAERGDELDLAYVRELLKTLETESDCFGAVERFEGLLRKTRR